MEFRNMTTDFQNMSFNCSHDMEYSSFCSHRHIIGNVFGSLITILIALISITGNLAVVIASFWSDTLRVQTGNLLIVYLSCTDILTGILVMIPSAISVAADYWLLGAKACKLHAIFNYWFACSSSFNLAVISFDRAVAVLFPFKYRIMMTKKVILMLCSCIFILSFTIGLTCGVPEWTSYNYSEGVCAMDYTSTEYSSVIYVFTTGCFFCYYLPAVLIAICNLLIIVTANRSNRSVQSLFIRRNKLNKAVKETNQSESDMKKTIKTMVIIVVIYYICFSPYALAKQVKVILGIDVPLWFNYLSTIFIYIASATNPFIYGILRRDYRDAFKRLPKMITEKFLN